MTSGNRRSQADQGQGQATPSSATASGCGGGGEAATYRLERRYRFSASHLYRRPEWTEEENRRHFGKCANLPGHGHNYRLFVTVRGPLDPRTSFVIDLGALDSLVHGEVVDRLDHQHLNAILPEFAPGRLIPSSESLLQWIRGKLGEGLPQGVDLVRLRLEEDEDLAAEWHLEDGVASTIA